MNTKHKPFPKNSPCKVSTNNTDSIQAKFKCRHENILQKDVLWEWNKLHTKYTTCQHSSLLPMDRSINQPFLGLPTRVVPENICTVLKLRLFYIWILIGINWTLSGNVNLVLCGMYSVLAPTVTYSYRGSLTGTCVFIGECRVLLL